jgi:hypothetical protein
MNHRDVERMVMRNAAVARSHARPDVDAGDASD